MTQITKRHLDVFLGYLQGLFFGCSDPNIINEDTIKTFILCNSYGHENGILVHRKSILQILSIQFKKNNLIIITMIIKPNNIHCIYVRAT